MESKTEKPTENMQSYVEFNILDGTGNSVRIENVDFVKAKIIQGGVVIKASIVEAEKVVMCDITADELYLKQPPYHYAKINVKKILVNGEPWQKKDPSHKMSRG